MPSCLNFTVFEYLYRDAANYKAWGSLLLEGSISPEAKNGLMQCLVSEEFFVAEQVSIPALYEGLYAYSGEPTVDDHAFHEFSEIRPATPEEVGAMTPWGSVTNLVGAFLAAKERWDVRLSSHCSLS